MLRALLFFAQVRIYADIVLAFVFAEIKNLESAIGLVGLLALALHADQPLARGVNRELAEIGNDPLAAKLLRDSGIRVVACTEKTKNDIYDVNLSGPIALIMGSEEDGISDILIREADELARIPLKGKIGSLNVSVASGVAIYETLRQRRK